MTVDVTVETTIEVPLSRVADFSGDPGNAPRWYANIRSVRWVDAPPVRVGSRLDFVAHFLGRELAYTYEVVELTPGRSMTMRTAQGPFPMATTYTWEALGPSRTRMTLRNHGEPAGLSRFAAPVMGRAVRRATTKDLASLKRLLDG